VFQSVVRVSRTTPPRVRRQWEDPMETLQPVEAMADEAVLDTFGTAAEPHRRGFDEATHTRVMAYELVRARHRLAHYQALYATFLEAGKPFMIENLDEAASDGGIPAKLVFTADAEHVLELAERPEVEVWTEPALLDALVQERAILDFFTELLNELEPAVSSP
jgi:hypothetical protein